MEMDRLLDALARVMKPAQVGRWLKQPNTAFDGSMPLQVVERGEQDRLWRMLYDLESGQPRWPAEILREVIRRTQSGPNGWFR